MVVWDDRTGSHGGQLVYAYTDQTTLSDFDADYVAHRLGVGEAALIAIYLGVFLPIGLLFRWLGRDALQRTPSIANAVSYWDECRAEPTKKSYLRRY